MVRGLIVKIIGVLFTEPATFSFQWWATEAEYNLAAFSGSKPRNSLSITEDIRVELVQPATDSLVYSRECSD